MCAELSVELSGLAAEDPGKLLAPGFGEMPARELELLGAVQERAVVDPDGVGVLVLDDRAVHEGAHVAERFVMQLAGRDPLGDGLGQVRCDRMHVGEAVGQRDRQLLTGWPLGDACADLVGERQLAAEIVRAFGADSEVSADGGDPALPTQAAMGVPLVVELLLVCQ
jgi:hypothetical protein